MAQIVEHHILFYPKCMKQIFYILTLACGLAALASCSESLEDRAARECKEFTEKNCPCKLNNGMSYDSVTFARDTRTIHHYYSVSGKGDNPTIFEKNKKEIENAQEKAIREDISSKRYKEAGFSIAVTIISSSTKQKYLEFKV